MKNYIYTLTLFVLLASCKDEAKPSVPKPIESDTIQPIEKSETQKVISDGEIYNQDGIIIYGDTTIDMTNISYISRKFEPYISFNDFKVAIEKGKKATLDLNSNDLGAEYPTMIKSNYKDEENLFAGHYSFAVWGCGAPCQMSALIDNKTGKIYEGPMAALGYDYKANSRMLIVNPPDSLGYIDNCAYCTPEIYILNETTKKFEQRKAAVE